MFSYVTEQVVRSEKKCSREKYILNAGTKHPMMCTQVYNTCNCEYFQQHDEYTIRYDVVSSASFLCQRQILSFSWGVLFFSRKPETPPRTVFPSTRCSGDTIVWFVFVQNFHTHTHTRPRLYPVRLILLLLCLKRRRHSVHPTRHKARL